MPVTYGAAYDSARARIEADSTIGAAPPYSCIGCGRPMVAKTLDRPNRKTAKHFAHKAENSACTYESILHADAKRIIAESIASAPKYWLGVICEACGNARYRSDVAGAETHLEQTVGGNRADVLVRTRAGKDVAIEVVVSHDLEKESQRRYEALGIPVLRARVASHDDLPGFRREIFVHERDYIGRELPTCAVCKRRRREEAREELKRQRKQSEWESHERNRKTMLGRVKRPTVACPDCGALFARPVGYETECPRGSYQPAAHCLFGENHAKQWTSDMRMLGLPLRRPPARSMI